MVLYSKVLRSAGHTVLQAIGSLEAMQLCLDRARIDLAIVDVVLTVPAVRLDGDTSRVRRVNGPQLIDDMVAVRKALRALLISSLDPSLMKEYGVVVGSVPFLQKPFSKDQLLDTMAMIVSCPPLVSKTSASKADTRPSNE